MPESYFGIQCDYNSIKNIEKTAKSSNFSAVQRILIDVFMCGQ